MLNRHLGHIESPMITEAVATRQFGFRLYSRAPESSSAEAGQNRTI